MKCDAREQLPIFTAEADQLALLARSKSVRVPEVYGVGSDRDYSFLLLEYQQLKPLDAHGAYCLGQQLAHLHQWSEQPQFGLDFDSDLTTTPQPNAWQRRWSEFFAEQRIGWQLQLAAEKGMTFGDIDDIVDRVYLRLLHHQPQPSLLHGNLWPGNCAMTAHGPILFDPASYWGDRVRFGDAAAVPRAAAADLRRLSERMAAGAGFIERQPLYQLYYLLNRSNLFGGQHLVAAQRAVEALLQPEAS